MSENESRSPARRRSSSTQRPLEGIARHGRLHSHPWTTFGKVVASVVAVTVVSVLGITGVAAVNLVSTTKHSVHLAGEAANGGAIPDIAALKGGVNVLMVASDTRTGQGNAWGTLADSAGIGNNDDNVLIHLSSDHTRLTVVQFPRDLEVPIPSCTTSSGGTVDAQDQAMLNTTLSEGGLSCVVSTIHALTGVNIPFAGLVTFDGVVALSNAVGGVQVCIGGAGIHDPNTSLNLDPGEVTLQGQNAAEFLRTRDGLVGGSDLSRLSNQQVFFGALARTVMSAGTLTNPVKLWGLAKAATSNITLSDSLDNITTLYQIASAMKGLQWSNITFMQYPVLADPEDSNRVIPDAESAQALDQALVNDQPVQLTAGAGEGSVTTSTTPITQPSAASTPAPSASSKSPAKSTPASSPSSTSSPASTAVTLGSNVYGQTAATQTCSNGAG
ncbi:LytR family transcriptional regulator [Planctomonas sp. JC2975]|uniref:LCP family protein n=1 Tax=Planctomonas sp. JC2975 TaxID=2729626 RepID=UPI0014765718|nr:LCP family protein [Planctomonas sp. JC2975]NNC12236.1 LytR family transcriptional regulator [Planctomonas sp. JC2975]